MKNIHLIQTDKPTGIFESNSGLQFSIMKKVRYGEFKGYNLYITSDEEIKKGDWVICSMSNNPTKALQNEDYSRKNDWKKIILTTDQDLIKDGVQAIDDEFLEWFCSIDGKVDFVEVIAIEDEKN